MRVLNVSCGGNKIYICQPPLNTICIGPGWVPACLASGYTMGQCGIGPIASEEGAPLITSSTPTLQLNEFIVKVSPNPSNNDFRIQVVGETEEAISVLVLDAVGRVLSINEKISKGQIITVGQNLSAGSYFAEVIQGVNRKMISLTKLN